MAFRKLTPQQRELYAALRVLGELILQPQDARPARALKRRGLVRYRIIDGARHIVLKQTHAERLEKAREHRWRKGDFWPVGETRQTPPEKKNSRSKMNLRSWPRVSLAGGLHAARGKRRAARGRHP